MANTGNSDKWYFTKDQLETTPSRLCGFDAYKELQYRQQAANFIQDMGQRLKVSQLCINTAIVYMHRFYVFHSFTDFPWYQMAAAALFLAAKVEEQPRKLEYVIRVANICKNPRDSAFDINSERYIAQSQDLVFNENVLLQTLGFDVAIDHPHTYVVRCCHLVRASKDLAQTSYFMASNSLHLTTMCIQYKPTVVACFCILLACKWSNWEIPLSNEKKEWFTYVDPTVTAELLEQLTSEFLVIFENCPSRLKEKITAKQESFSSPNDQDKKPEGSIQRALDYKGDDPHKHRSRPHDPSSSGHKTQEQKEREYRERKEKEKIAHMSGITLPHHHHRSERPLMDQKMKPHSRPSSSAGIPPTRTEPRDILREASKEPSFGLPTLHDPSREHVKESVTVRSDKELLKRDLLLKPNAQTELNNLNSYSDVRQRIDPNRPRIDPKSASKQELMRRYEEQQKTHIKSETDNIKKHLSSSYDKNSAYLKSSSSTSQKIKSPFNLDNKSVPKSSSSQAGAHLKPHYNGNTNGSYNKLPSHEHEVKIKTETVTIKEEIPTPAVIKRPSLFSPEKTPPQVKSEKAEPLTHMSLNNLTALSPITSPPSVQSSRNRNYSSSSEPELRPTMKKIDQVEGFETLRQYNTIGVSNIHNTDSTQVKKEDHSSRNFPIKSEIKIEPASPVKDSINCQNTIVNGLETNPTIISNLLKEAATNSHLPGVASTSIKTESVEPNNLSVLPVEQKEKEHHHHKSKKKKEKHKHKDREKSKDDKERRRKHKDKEKEKHKHKEKKEAPETQPLVSEPIKIKIQKDKIQPLNEGLKIKIPKDKINQSLPQPSSGGLKIKIPKEVITNCNTSGGGLGSSLDISVTSSTNSSRKRDRERLSPAQPAPSKMAKISHKDSKQNGRPSYNKVSPNVPHSNDNELDTTTLISSDSYDDVNEKIPKKLSPIVSPIHEEIEKNNNYTEPSSLNSSLDTLCENASKVQNSASVFSTSLSPKTDTTIQSVSVVNVSTSNISEPNSSNEQNLTSNDHAKILNKELHVSVHKQTYPKQPRPNGYDNYSMPPNKVPYHGKSHRGSYNAPRYAHNSQMRHPPPPRHMNYHPQTHSQNPSAMSYPSVPPPPMSFNPFQMPPPSMLNMNVPPPTFMYNPGYFPGYIYQEMYQPPGSVHVFNPPPLPLDAPPTDIPPPPPPDEA